MTTSLSSDFYSLVPRDLVRNLEYRIALRERCIHDEAFRRACWVACKEDVLFFLAAFCFVYEPRPRKVNGVRLPQTVPFIPWSHQAPVIRVIRENLGFRDIAIEKSRGEGASWILVLLALHDWIFNPMSAIGLVSRNEDAVDSPMDPSSLFWKLDWEIKKLPLWMGGSQDRDWKRNLAEHTLFNLRNGSSITGYAATADVASSSRFLWFGMDELAKFPRGPDKEAMTSTQQVTESRFVVSTPKGDSGAYYDVTHRQTNVLKLKLPWWENQTRNRGLYKFVKGRCVPDDPVNNPLPPNYENNSQQLFERLRGNGFTLEGRWRSPWYDAECDRALATPTGIAQELDIDYGGSMYRVFGAEFFTAAEQGVKRPYLRGMLNYDREALEPEWETIDDGPMLLWTSLDAQGNPPNGQYVVGADLSTGAGGSYTSNSVVVVVDQLTGEQVLECAVNTMPPANFTDLCVTICKWFHGAFLIWEADGPGTAFTGQLKDRHYPYVYLRPVFDRKGNVKTKRLGWHTSKDSKEKMFSDLGFAVTKGDLTLHSDLLVKECGQYVRAGAGSIEHSAEANEDRSTRKQAHGDRAIAMCVCWQGCKDRPLLRPAEDDPLEATSPAPRGTMAARIQRIIQEQKVEDEWDDRDISEYVRAA